MIQYFLSSRFSIFSLFSLETNQTISLTWYQSLLYSLPWLLQAQILKLMLLLEHLLLLLHQSNSIILITWSGSSKCSHPFAAMDLNATLIDLKSIQISFFLLDLDLMALMERIVRIHSMLFGNAKISYCSVGSCLQWVLKYSNLMVSSQTSFWVVEESGKTIWI